MQSKYYEEIVNKSVVYYENSYLYPQVEKQVTKESILDYSGYFYAYGIKLIQNFFKKKRDESQKSFLRLITETYGNLPQSVKSGIISDFNRVYGILLDQFKNGMDNGEESMEGFKIMLDSCAKIIASSLYWLENKI